MLPRRVSIGWGALSGRISWRLGIRRRVVLENLALAFPEWSDARRREVGRASYENFGRTVVEMLCLRSYSADELESLTDGIEGTQYVDEVGNIGQGLVVVTGHIGNWEFMGAYFARRGYQFKVIAKPVHNPRVEAEIAATRRACGFDILYTGEGMSSGLRHLRGGGVLAILADQDARRTGVGVPFFGVPASTALGPAVFAALEKVPILPVFSVRVDSIRHRYHVYPPIRPIPGEPRDKAIERMTVAHVAALEDFVRKHPEQYFWLHRRWKTPPRKLRLIGDAGKTGTQGTGDRSVQSGDRSQDTGVGSQLVLPR
jgi:KDO2-lipid IV(A) lauroyltransferase